MSHLGRWRQEDQELKTSLSNIRNWSQPRKYDFKNASNWFSSCKSTPWVIYILRVFDERNLMQTEQPRDWQSKPLLSPPVKEKARHHSASASHPAQLHHHFLRSFLLFSHKDMALFPGNVTEKGLLSSPSADHYVGINQRSQSKTLRGSHVTGSTLLAINMKN